MYDTLFRKSSLAARLKRTNMASLPNLLFDILNNGINSLPDISIQNILRLRGGFLHKAIHQHDTDNRGRQAHLGSKRGECKALHFDVANTHVAAAAKKSITLILSTERERAIASRLRDMESLRGDSVRKHTFAGYLRSRPQERGRQLLVEACGEGELAAEHAQGLQRAQRAAERLAGDDERAGGEAEPAARADADEAVALRARGVQEAVQLV